MKSHQVISVFNNENNGVNNIRTNEEPWYEKKSDKEKEWIKAMLKSGYSEQDVKNLLDAAYVPPQRKVVHIDHKHDVIYFAGEPTDVATDSNQSEQSVSGNRSFCRII